MTEESHTIQVPPIKDRTTGLIILGILQLCLACLMAIVMSYIAATLLGVSTALDVASAKDAEPVANADLLTWGLPMIWFVSMGFGSIKAKRWTPPLVLASSWLWLFSGMLRWIHMVIPVVIQYAQIGESDRNAPLSFGIGWVIFVALFSLIQVLPPIALILFYRGKSVEETCAFHNQGRSWTDGSPLSLLVQVMVFAYWPLAASFLACHHGVFPFFGVVLQGEPGVAVLFVLAITGILLSWGSYKRWGFAWWAALLSVLVVAVSFLVTFFQTNMTDIYAKMDYSEQVLAAMRDEAYSDPSAAFPLFATSVGLIAMLGLLLYNRRHFFNNESPA